MNMAHAGANNLPELIYRVPVLLCTGLDASTASWRTAGQHGRTDNKTLAARGGWINTYEGIHMVII